MAATPEAYAALISISVNIITVEDPVENRTSELVQVQIHEKGLG
jgi:type II secretory ATPase GspE/PulE/Tfp pilus assembly ATPase PilB-like protein